MGNHLLIADDSAANRLLLKRILEKRMPELIIHEADNGLTALEIIHTGQVNVVILDINMPVMDGLQVLEELAKTNVLDRIPVVMFTAVDEIESIQRALQLGALDYFTKPLTEEQIKIKLHLKIKNALEFYAQRNELLRFQEHIQQELKLAENLQRSLVEDYHDFDEWEMWGRYIPCERIGGDLFACRKMGDRLWFIMADVSGHGIASAMIATMLKTVFTLCLSTSRNPGELLGRMNEAVFEAFGQGNNTLISAFVGCLEQNTLYYSNAGHQYPIKYRAAAKEIKEVAMNGFLLGILHDVEYETRSMPFHTGDTLLIFTDGLCEGGDSKGSTNWRAVYDYCVERASGFEKNIPLLLQELQSYFFAYTTGSFQDDVAIMALRSKEHT